MGRPLLVMREHKALYGVWAENVREVQPAASTTPLPGNIPYFEGIHNYKGRLIPVFSLARISGRTEQDDGAERILVILDGGGGIYGLMTSEVLSVTEETDEKMPHDNMKLDNGILQISEIIRTEEPVFVLDMEKILETLKNVHVHNG